VIAVGIQLGSIPKWQGVLSAAAPPPHPAVTDRGTNQTKGSATLTISSVTVASGSTLVAIVGLDVTGADSPDSLKWGTFSLTLHKVQGTGAHYYLENCAGGTHDLVADYTSNAPGVIVMTAKELVGALASSHDVSAGASGTSTAPSSGSSGTLSQASEICIASVLTHGPLGDTAGSWSNSFVGGQRQGSTGGTAGSNVTISDASLIVAATTAQTGAKTGITSRSYSAIITTYKANP
jgi:hypothetical protein